MSSLSITIARATEPAVHGGPVGLRIDVCNRSREAVETDLSFPSERLVIRPRDAGFVVRPGDEATNRERATVRLAPDACVGHRYEVQRYVRFPGPGRYTLDVALTVGVDRGGDVRDDQAAAVVEVTLGMGTPDALAQALAAASAGLRDADGRAEAIEALIHLDVPEVRPHLEAALAVVEHRADVVRALGRLGGEPALAAVERVLTTSDLPTLYAGLAVLSAGKRAVAPATLRAIADGGDGAQAALLEYVLEAHAPIDAALVARLAASANPNVADLARRVRDRSAP